MKQFATVRGTQLAARVGEQAPVTAVCCNACRTCVTTNLIGLGSAALAAITIPLARSVKRRSRAV